MAFALAVKDEFRDVMRHYGLQRLQTTSTTHLRLSNTGLWGVRWRQQPEPLYLYPARELGVEETWRESWVGLESYRTAVKYRKLSSEDARTPSAPALPRGSQCHLWSPWTGIISPTNFDYFLLPSA